MTTRYDGASQTALQKEHFRKMTPSSANLEPTQPAKPSGGVPAGTGESKVLDFDAIVDAYLEQSKDGSVLREGSGQGAEVAGTRTARHDFIQEILVAAIVDGFDRDSARHLAGISVAEMNRLIASENVRHLIEAGRSRSPELRRLDLICALKEVDAQEKAVEYAGGDFDEYMRMGEDGRMEEIELLETAAAMRAAGKWHLVKAGLRLEILERAL
jgi:hypothetical protein